MLLNWFNTKEVDEFAGTIVAELIKRIPPTSDLPKRKRKEKLSKTHKVLFDRAEQFARSHRLNIYQKARLGNRFKWALREAGYPPDFVEAWSYELIRFMAIKGSAQG